VLLSSQDAARHTAQLKEMASGEQAELDWADLPGRLA
jgi:hypothetical protein